MDQGDIGFIFPNIIHHYQVFSCQHNQAIYLNASPFLVDRFTDILENKAPKPPVIKAFSIEPDVYHAFNSILGAQKDDIYIGPGVSADYTGKMYSDDEISGKEQNWQR